MPHFYLHVCNGDGFVEDQQGQDLPDLEAARRKAVEGLRRIAATDLRSGQLNMAAFIEIEDAQHQLLETVPFDDAVEVTKRKERRREG